MTASTTNRSNYVAFPIDNDLRDEAYDLIDQFRESEDCTKLVNELIRVVADISHCGLNYYFLHPLQLAGVNKVSLKAVSIGLKSGQKVVLTVASRIAKGMNQKQLLIVIDFIEKIIYEFEE